MNDVALVGLLTLAIGIGFFLGKRAAKAAAQRAAFAPDKNYFQGLNYLLNEQPDKAVEAFVDSLDVNSYTLETHLALGKLMRRQGQVDRAIRIHQNLLARPVLEEADQHQVHLELARDFMAAGLLDRAEVLLQEVIGESTELRGIAQRY
ncbi:MAG: lipopolysaccharide assembly protein LapB, partial [Gammaproteobacteria bacterium]|nr:lipopolysaccharide assembly protein LapB [Gammaproteobacteria bacterium]